jgi:hypothetical protein
MSLLPLQIETQADPSGQLGMDDSRSQSQNRQDDDAMGLPVQADDDSSEVYIRKIAKEHRSFDESLQEFLSSVQRLNLSVDHITRDQRYSDAGYVLFNWLEETSRLLWVNPERGHRKIQAMAQR